MNVDCFAREDDSFASYDFNDKSHWDISSYDSWDTQHFDDDDDCSHFDENESTVASYTHSNSSYGSSYVEDGTHDHNFAVPSKKIMSVSKEKVGCKSSTGRVSFGGVAIREYKVVVGYQDISCPLELDWDFVELNLPSEEDYSINSVPRSRIRPLSYRERKEIIALSQGIPIWDVKYLEKEMLDLRNCCSRMCIIPKRRCRQQVDAPPRQPRYEFTTAEIYSTTIYSTTSDCTPTIVVGHKAVSADSPPRRPHHSNEL